MPGARVFELARELNKTPEEIREKLRELGVKTTAPVTYVNSEDARRLRRYVLTGERKARGEIDKEIPVIPYEPYVPIKFTALTLDTSDMTYIDSVNTKSEAERMMDEEKREAIKKREQEILDAVIMKIDEHIVTLRGSMPSVNLYKTEMFSDDMIKLTEAKTKKHIIMKQIEKFERIKKAPYHRRVELIMEDGEIEVLYIGKQEVKIPGLNIISADDDIAKDYGNYSKNMYYAGKKRPVELKISVNIVDGRVKSCYIDYTDEPRPVFRRSTPRIQQD